MRDVYFGAKRGTYSRSVARTRGPNVGRVELKCFEGARAVTSLAATTADWTNTEYDVNVGIAALCLFAPIQGNDIVNRIGRKVFMRKLKIRGVITMEGGTADSPVEVRYVVYMDTQTNATQAQGEQVLGYGGPSSIVAANAVHMFMNPANFGRFKILKDKVIVLKDTNLAIGGAAGQYQVVPFKCNVTLNTPVEFNSANGGTVADIVNNSLHLIAMANSAAGVPKIQYVSRVTFTDN